MLTGAVYVAAAKWWMYDTRPSLPEPAFFFQTAGLYGIPTRVTQRSLGGEGVHLGRAKPPQRPRTATPITACYRTYRTRALITEATHRRTRMRTLPFGLWLGLAACAGKQESMPDTTTATTETTGGGSGTEEAPLTNGPGGSAVISAACAPNDGPAWSLRIGLGSACDAGAPDPNTPYVHINVYDGALMASAVDSTWTGSDGQYGTLTYAPNGANGATQTTNNVTLYIGSWQDWSASAPEVGGEVSGWYTATLEDGTEIGAAFSGPWCGGSPMCG